MNQAIAKLESIKVVPAEDDSAGNTCCKMKVSDYKKIFQALEILKQQPAAGEFTKRMRKIYNEDVWGNCQVYEDILEFSDRLDRAEAEIKSLEYQLNCTNSHYKRAKEYTACYINMLIECFDFSEREKANLSVLAGAETIRKKIKKLEATNKDLLEVCEYIHKYLTENVGQATHAIAFLESVIAKAKKEGKTK